MDRSPEFPVEGDHVNPGDSTDNLLNVRGPRVSIVDIVRNAKQPINKMLTANDGTIEDPSRREFLLNSGRFAVGAAIGLTVGFPNSEVTAQEGEIPLTLREEPGFTWPIDIRGSEELLGHDILLTIDDCHLHTHLQSMFDCLRVNNVTATFFPNSEYLPLDNPEIVRLWREIYAAGNNIGYHTTTHGFGGDLGDAGNWTVEQISADFDAFTQHMRELLGDEAFTPIFARPPYGSWNQNWMEFVAQRNLTNIRWNFVPQRDDGLDYFKAVTRHPQGGGIILLHTREWDTYWLGKYIHDLVSFAQSENGRVIRLSGNLTV